MSNKCELCRRIAEDDHIYVDDVVVIVNCAKCGDIPLLIFRQHGGGQAVIPSGDLARADKTVMRLYGDNLLYCLTFQKHGANHEHWHIITRGE